MNEFEHLNQHEKIHRAMPATEPGLLQDTGGASHKPRLQIIDGGQTAAPENFEDQYNATKQVLGNLGISHVEIDRLPSLGELPNTNIAQAENFIDQHYPDRQASSFIAHFPIRDSLAQLVMRYRRHYDSAPPAVSRFWKQLTLSEINGGREELQLGLVINDTPPKRAEPLQPSRHWFKNYLLEDSVEITEADDDPADYPGIAYRHSTRKEQDLQLAGEAEAAQVENIGLHPITLAEFMVLTAVKQELGLRQTAPYGVKVRLQQIAPRPHGKHDGPFKFFFSERIATVSYNGVLGLTAHYVHPDEITPGVMRVVEISAAD
jgi:hypothetical protein